VQLFGSAQDDGLPSGTLATQWSKVSGPGAVSFANGAALATQATFSSAGTYVLQLRASDGDLSDADTIQIVITTAQAIATLQIHPRFATLRTGARQQFWISARDGSGRPVNVAPTWTTTRGAVSTTGLHTAPSWATGYAVTATVNGMSVRAQVESKTTMYWPQTNWPTASASTMGMSEAQLALARDYALIGGGAGAIVRGGRVVMSWGSQTTRYDIKSSTKSLGGATALGLAIMDGTVDISDAARMHLPSLGIPPQSNAETGRLDDITLLHLATHTSGFQKAGGYTSVIFQPGSRWLYSDGGANWLADALTRVFAADLNSVLFTRAFAPIGIKTSDLTWRANAYRETTLNGITRREFGSGIFANVNAMTRVGYLYLRRGDWNGVRILPDRFVEQVQQPPEETRGTPVYDAASFPANSANHYGVLWWTNADSTLPNVPRDAYWSWGLGDMLVIVIPSLDIVAVRTGSSLRGSGWNADYGDIDPLITPIAKSVNKKVGVPSLAGLTRASAADALDKVGLSIANVTQRSSSVAAGRVISHSPSSGAQVVRNTSVSLVISSGQ
jgi:CubicO group peptidase (beta-lactamase class C family)